MQKFVFVVDCERIGRKKSYMVRFKPNNQLIQRIKDLPKQSRRWDGINMGWIITADGLLTIMKYYKGSNKIHFNFGEKKQRDDFIKIIDKIKRDKEELRKKIEELNKKKERWIKFKVELEKNYKQYSKKVHENLKENITLFPHQIVAAMFLNETRSALISHDMGVGKTASSIAYVEMNDFEKVIVITPNSLKFNYYNEVDKFTNSKAHILNWKKNKYSIEESKYIIFNYEYLNPSNKKTFIAKWEKLNINVIDCIILDEAHRIKSTKSNTYKNFKSLFTSKIFRNGIESKVFLSGTPAPNRAHELYTVLNQISPIDFSTKSYFYEYYCGMKYDFDGWGYTQVGDNKFEELYHKIAPYTHRKRKEDVLKNLPDKTYQKIIFELSRKEYSLYCDIEGAVANEMNLHPSNNPLTVMIRLRQYLSQLKINHLKELTENILNSEKKIVIVDMFKDSLYELKEFFGDIAGLHTGDQSVEGRAEIVKEFQDPKSKIKIFLGSIQTCNYGLTLTAASDMFILTSPYSVGELDQVSDRIHRIGQKDAVNIYMLTFSDTIDEIVFNIIENKRKEIKKVIDNENYESNVDETVLSEIIRKLKQKHA